jgi:predicted PurR-regulated permease PerM
VTDPSADAHPLPGGGGDAAGVPPWLVVAGGYAWRIAVMGVVGYYALFLLGRLSAVVLPIVIAVILATLCMPAVDALRARGVPSAGAAAIVVVGGLAAIIGLLVAIAPSFASQIADLRPTVEQGIDSLLESAAGFGYDQARLDELLGQVREQLSGSASTIVSGVGSGLAVALEGLTGLLLLVVLLFFFVKDKDEITGWMIARTPPGQRELVRAVGARAWQAMAGYVRGTATIAAIDAVAIGIGLALIQVPLVLPLALLVFLGAFLPVIGAFLAGLVATLVALAAGGLTKALLTLALIVAVQQVEGNVLHPMIMRRAVALHPVVVLVGLAIGATLAGIVGAFLSLPVMAVTTAVGNELRVRAEGAAVPTADTYGTAPDAT